MLESSSKVIQKLFQKLNTSAMDTTSTKQAQSQIGKEGERA